MSKQTIYRWWGSKAAILGEALRQGEYPEAEVNVPSSDDLGADLRAWLTAASAGLADADGVAVAWALIVVTASDPAQGPELSVGRSPAGEPSVTARTIGGSARCG